MILQRIGNRGLFLGALFEDAARRNPYQRITVDQPLDVAPQLGNHLTVYSCANLIADLAAALLNAGIRPTEKVVIYKSDNFDIFLLACAAAHMGAVPVMLSPELAPGVVAQLLPRCGRPHLIGDARTLIGELSPTHDAAVTGILTVGDALPGARVLRADSDSDPYPYRRPSKHTPMLITHTSGTTGLPKLVVHTAYTMRARYRPQAAGAYALVRRDDTVAIQVSFVHSRLVTAMAIALRRGMPLVVLSSKPPGELVEILARTQPEVIEAQPNSLVEWEQLANDSRAPLTNLKVLSTTFDAMHPRTVRMLLGASTQRNPAHVQLYGQSEVGPVAGRITRRRRASRDDWRSVGFAFPGMTAVRIADPKGPADTGRIEVRTDGRAVTYLGENDRYRAQLCDGWWRMGDLGSRSSRGEIYLADREVDQIAGVASTLEIEDVLLQRLPGLHEVVVIPDREGKPTPVVVTKDGTRIEPGQWQNASHDLPPMQAPIHLPLAELPRTSTRKVQRLSLARKVFDG